MIDINYNPDVLTCLANLSNDEVFTPPTVVNSMLDLLPPELWSDKNATFLDPVCKSGVFLREIAKRLIEGLESEFPDKKERINHIFQHQLFGIAITELTSLLSRRSVYCSKKANGEYSVCDTLTNEQGNVIYDRIEHTWNKGKCIYCGASEDVYDRAKDLETHAYQFIHTDEPENLFTMKFDVIVGNPPYQLSDGGFGRSAGPIYNLFVQQAKKLNPRYITMIIPSRWFAGGKGLSSFREEMLNDDRMSRLIDFPDASEVFPGVDIAGGVCYFLWDREHSGLCEVTNVHQDNKFTSERPLNEFQIFIRHGRAIQIIKKVVKKKETSLSLQVSSAKPFGLRTYVRPNSHGDLTLRYNKGEGPFKKEDVPIGEEMIDEWKTITSKVSYDHAGQPDKNGMRRVFSIVDILPPKTICTETYLVVGSFKDKQQAENLANYLRNKFVRFLVAQLTFSQDIFKDKFLFVPSLDMNKKWSDEDLYERYKITSKEVEFIESQIRPMD